jgi:hypothetical protein
MDEDAALVTCLDVVVLFLVVRLMATVLTLTILLAKHRCLGYCRGTCERIIVFSSTSLLFIVDLVVVRGCRRCLCSY